MGSPSAKALLLLLLLLLLLFRGPAARPATPRARRHSDGTFTSELSRLRESARLQRLLKGLVGKRSEQDTVSSAPALPPEGQLCPLLPRGPPCRPGRPRGTPGQGLASRATFQTWAWNQDFGASDRGS